MFHNLAVESVCLLQGQFGQLPSVAIGRGVYWGVWSLVGETTTIEKMSFLNLLARIEPKVFTETTESHLKQPDDLSNTLFLINCLMDVFDYHLIVN